jgi:hypothetical protein
MAEYREITAKTYDEAQSQLNPDETLVSANYGDIRRGHIAVTSDRSFRTETSARHKIYARKA